MRPIPTPHPREEKFLQVVVIGQVTDTEVVQSHVLEAVGGVCVDLRVDTTAEDKARQGVEVCQQDHGVDQLCQRPAVLTSLHQLLKGGWITTIISIPEGRI